MLRSIQEWWNGPWRKPAKHEWDEKYSDDLKKSIGDMEFNDIGKVGFLLCGPHQSGKSSFVNSVISISKGRQAHFATAMGGGASITSKFRIIPDDDYFKNFEIRDTHGLAENEEVGFNITDLIYALNGHIKENYKFTGKPMETTNNQFYRKEPCAADKSYCLVFVLDVQLLTKFTDKYFAKFRQVVNEIEDKGIPMVLLLTKVDEIYPYLKKDVKYLFHSRAVEEAVKRAEKILGVQMKNIHPIVNFVQETDVDPVKSIPILLALKQILHYASDNIESQSRKSAAS